MNSSGRDTSSEFLILYTEGPGMKQDVKAHLLASQELLVESLYNLAPLLDCALARGLLSQDNYYEVKAEKTPPNRARKLLEVVQAQMDEREASCFLECLKRCEHHYPRLRSWLSHNTDIQRGPTECQLQSQFSVLCARLGHSVLPVSLALFSTGIITQFELDQVQSATILYQQAQKLLTICLSKGESACRAFYSALNNEDENLAEEIRTGGLPEALPVLSVESESDVNSFPIAVEETSAASAEADSQSGILQEVLGLLGIVSGEARLNICELGVMLGLPRWSVREALLEEVGVEDGVQLEVMVDLFLQKTQDAPLLLSRVQQCNIQRAQLSERGSLLLKLLQEAESLLHRRDFLHGGGQACTGDLRDMVEAIFIFLLWECMAQVLEEPISEPGRSALECVAELRAGDMVDVSLLQELEECLRDGGAEAMGQSARVLAQILRDLHPQQHCLHLSPPQDGTYSCRPRKIHRITRFRGLLTRVIRKVGRSSGFSLSAAAIDQDEHLLTRQHREVCVRVARLLERVRPDGGATAHQGDSDAAITQHLKFTLSQEGFRAEVFDAGMRHRLLGMLEFSPARMGLGSLMQLHLETLAGLERYLQQGEHHSFQFAIESVRTLGGAQLCSVEHVRGPVAIDNGLEEVYCFMTSEPTSFLVRVCCRGYERECRFEVCNPQCVRLSQLDWATLQDTHRVTEGIVLAEEGGCVWVREGDMGWMEKLQVEMQRNRLQLNDQGCCFKVTSQESECKIKFIYKNGRISACAVTNCDIL
ncbi:uncharacterized protein LOC121688220 isoform X1 [Alosa sapidissima]|uniref:uncharacterized protein LOC121688220 isoform X1 n=1 Tax=Alosa sapidissima TaxID=34773 RepID=UPI001C09C1D0|nr:uncharacterized protein LOC121688220 isoform X1 [Alosa sapidissima]